VAASVSQPPLTFPGTFAKKSILPYGTSPLNLYSDSSLLVAHARYNSKDKFHHWKCEEAISSFPSLLFLQLLSEEQNGRIALAYFWLLEVLRRCYEQVNNLGMLDMWSINLATVNV
jgi:hypothetical protein